MAGRERLGDIRPVPVAVRLSERNRRAGRITIANPHAFHRRIVERPSLQDNRRFAKGDWIRWCVDEAKGRPVAARDGPDAHVELRTARLRAVDSTVTIRSVSSPIVSALTANSAGPLPEAGDMRSNSDDARMVHSACVGAKSATFSLARGPRPCEKPRIHYDAQKYLTRISR